MDPVVEAFGDAAADYERARPSYPDAAVALLEAGSGVRVCDLAAGTGKLTRLLAATGADVVAVEPVDGMRAELVRTAPDVRAVDGTAEAIPLDDGSVDLVTVAQAFHWFDFDPALAEIARVLRPGGRLAILFNERDERTSWVKEWNERIEWHSRRIAYYQNTDWTAVLAAAGYAGVRDEHIEWHQPMTRELIAARVRSVSYVAAEPPDVQQDYVDRVVALTEGFDEPFDLPYVTHVWLATRP
jgi:ubiquinone/menaquinone biosynthesis C-methylase UbiE